MHKLIKKQQKDLQKKQKGHAVPTAPKSHLTDDVVMFFRQAAATQTNAVLAETLANILKEPKLYLVKAIVNNVPSDLICTLLGLTIDI